MENYQHLSLSERIELYRLHKEGHSMRAIATVLGRSASTISRELRRNSEPTKVWRGGYEPARAQSVSERRRHWDARFKLAGQLKAQTGHCVISHESIYRFVYHRSAQKDYWHRLLPRRKSRRGRLGMRGGSPVQHIQGRVPIHARPREVDTRRTVGHWEGDLMLFSRYGQAVLVSHERSSRLLLAHRQPNKAADPVARKLLRQFAALPARLRRSITFDNGTEFSHHHRLTRTLNMATYF